MLCCFAFNVLTFFISRFNSLYPLTQLPLLSLPPPPCLFQDDNYFVKIIRAFRLLRPLKFLSFFPSLRLIISALVSSLPDLLDLLIVIVMIVFLFGIIGVSLFSGPYLHTRCRLTPFPVTTQYVIGSGANPALYRCLNASNFNELTDKPTWKFKHQSDWHKPQDCFWPIDTSDQKYCSLGDGGRHNCFAQLSAYVSEFGSGGNYSKASFCGSNFDALGNPR